MAPLAGLLAGAMASAQNFSVHWFTVDGGGGTSTGGAYSVSGTIGQPDASRAMFGGDYQVIGGFWAAESTPLSGIPTLIIVPAGPGQAIISWSPDSPGYALQETTSLSPVNWINSPSGASNPVGVPVIGPTKFYRLFKP